MEGTPPIDRAELARRGRIGGLTTSATHDARAINERARQVYKDSFLAGHECIACPLIRIPQELPDHERRRRADALRRAHFARLALLRGRRRRR